MGLTVTLKLTVSTLTLQALFHFRANVLECGGVKTKKTVRNTYCSVKSVFFENTSQRLSVLYLSLCLLKRSRFLVHSWHFRNAEFTKRLCKSFLPFLVTAADGTDRKLGNSPGFSQLNIRPFIKGSADSDLTSHSKDICTCESA